MRRAAALLVLLAGCGRIDTYHVTFRPPTKTTGDAELFIDRTPDRPFAEIGLVQAMGFGSKAEAPIVLDALRAEGRRLGCDAVVRARVDEGGSGAHAAGVCVVWAERR